jgi:hypothetical protein
VRALLDENMPRSLIRLLAPEIEARTVQQEGWRGRRNGDLLSAAAAAGFDAFITTDRGIPHQQNISRYGIGVVLLEAPSNRAEDLASLVPRVKDRIRALHPVGVIRVAA